MKLNILCMILFFVLHVQPAVSQVVQCYSEFSPNSGTCSDRLGEISLDDCCMNPKYGYVKDGVCNSCRYAAWTEWSSWTSCSVSCLEGVRQRKRACYGIGRCQDLYKQGSIQTESCEDRDCCPEYGGWSEWSPWQPCSVTCESGTKMRNRKCTEPPPKCGGSCLGASEETASCDTGLVCPIHGGWSAWSGWGACMETCHNEGLKPPQQQRQRTCTNPPPSTVPPGDDCQGPSLQTQDCPFLPFCPVNGNWGAWSAPSQCSVTCGVGRQTHHRKCDNPEPKHGGEDCRGEDTKMTLCLTDKNCPADGHWSEWGQWGMCKPLSNLAITCKKGMGRWRRLRTCLGRDHDGQYCPGDNVDFGSCYEIDSCSSTREACCKIQSIWSEWSKWSFCKPDCGDNSTQTRQKTCIPDISEYRNAKLEMFSGRDKVKCQKSSEPTEESRSCLNVPKC